MARTLPLEHLEAVLAVGIGGFAGSKLRYFVELLAPSSLAATAMANVLGCCDLGFLIYEELLNGTISKASRTLMAAGFIASFTTQSTFVIDALTTTPMLAISYMLGSYAVGFGAVLVGREATRWVTSVAPSPSHRERATDGASSPSRNRRRNRRGAALYCRPVLVHNRFPFSTLVVSVVGSFVLGLVVFAGFASGVDLFVGAGACGSFTTQSSFSG